MKALALTVFMVALGVQAQSLRVVGGKQVDLSPLVTWLSKPAGERPLPHWKEIRISAVNGKLSQSFKCDAVIEGKPKAILISNLNPEMAGDVQKYEAERTWLLRESERLKKESDRIELANATVPVGAGGNPAYVDAVMAQRQKLNLDTIKLNKDIEAHSARQEAALALLEKIRSTTDLAMFTGQTYSGLEVWDCGIRK